jgi:hypothetical protein
MAGELLAVVGGHGERQGLDRLQHGDDGASEASSLARRLETVLAETRARESALEERKRVLEQRWEEAQKRRYTAKRGS